MKKLSVVFAFVALMFTTSCNSQSKEHSDNSKHGEKIKSDGHKHQHGGEHGHDGGDTEKRDIASTSKKSTLLTGLIDSYLSLKNGLTEDNNTTIVSSAKTMLKAFSSFEMKKLTSAQHKEYMEIAENSKEQLEHIIKSPIDHQREHFEVLSNDLNDLISLIGTDRPLYQDFCPMYNKGKGAIWISESKEIKNPYYGTKMVSCGKIQKEIK